MRLRQAASALVFGATSAGVGAVLAFDPEAAPASAHALCDEVGPRAPVEVRLAPGTLRLHVESFLLVEAAEPPASDLSWKVEVEWAGANGEPLGGATSHERSRVDWRRENGAVVTDVRLPGDPRWVSSPRVSEWAIRELLQRGGTARVRVDGGERSDLLRVFALETKDPLAWERSLIAPSRRQVDRALRESGLGSWDLLLPPEKRRVLGTSWTRLLARGEVTLRPVVQEGRPLPEAERRMRDLRVDPGRALALNLRGPFALGVEGTLRTSRVGPGDHPLREAPGEDGAIVLSSEATGPATVVLRNEGSAPVWPAISLVAGEVSGEPATFADPGGGLRLAPERRDLPAVEVRDLPWRIDAPGFEGGDALRLTVRPLLDGMDDRRPRRLRVHGLDAGGRALFSAEAEVEAIASPFEEASRQSPEPGPDDLAGRAVGEPVSLRVGAGAFLHLELSPETRARLAADADLRATLLRALEEPW